MDNTSNKSLGLERYDLIQIIIKVLLIFIIVCVSLLNLTLQWGNQNLWIGILSGTVGYIIPNPKLKNGIDSLPSENGATAAATKRQEL